MALRHESQYAGLDAGVRQNEALSGNPLNKAAPEETLQMQNPLEYGECHGVRVNQPEYAAMQNVNPNPYNPNGSIPYGEQVFGQGKGYDVFTFNVDTRHLVMHTVIDEPLLYRSNIGVGRVEGQNVRIVTPSVTRPASTARFSGGRVGDNY